VSPNSDKLVDVVEYARPGLLRHPEIKAAVKLRLFVGFVLPPALAYAWAWHRTNGMRYRDRENYVAFPFLICSVLLAAVGVFLIVRVIQRRWPVLALWALLAIFGIWVIFAFAMLNLCIWPQFSSNPGW
jgi:hypothetical protein